MSVPALRWGCLAVTVAVVGAVVGVLFSGSTAPPALLDPGPVVRWGLPLTTVALHLSAMITVGGLSLCSVVLRPGTTAWRRASLLSAGAAILWAVAQALDLVLVHASIMGAPPDGAGYPALLVQFVTGVDVGTILAAAVVQTAVAAILAVMATTAPGARVAVVAAGAALIPLAGQGHAAGAGSHELAVSAMWLHLAGIGLWAGGLAVLVLAVRGGVDGLAHSVSRYSSIAGWAVVLVVGSGVANAWTRVSALEQLVTTAWGLLLTAKTLAVALLVLAGWWHRRVTIPHLASTADSARPFWRLAGVEVLVMAAVVGVSVALGSAPPPVPQAELTPGAELRDLPAPWFAGLVTAWSPEPILLLLAGAGAWVYLGWVRRLRARGDRWPVTRTVCWLIGMALLVWVTSGGPHAYGGAVFSAHMLSHMMLVSVLPIFWVLASPVSLALRALPRRTDGSAGPRELLLSTLHAPWARFFAHPLVAALNVPVTMAVFYLSPLFELSLRSHLVHLLVMVHFCLAGYLFTSVIIGTDPGPRRPFYPVRLALLLPSMVFHTFFGLFLLSSTSLLAGEHFTALGPLWSDPLADQQVGGALAWAMGEIPALALAVVVATRWATHDARNQARRRSAPAASPPAPEPAGADR